MYSATRSAPLRQLVRRSSPTTGTSSASRSFALHHSTTTTACPVTPTLRTAVSATLLVSFVYLASHEDALDQAVAPRSGLHYFNSPHHHQQHHSTAPSPSSSPVPTSSPAFAMLPSLSSSTPRASLGGGLHHELRMAGVFGRSLSA